MKATTRDRRSPLLAVALLVTAAGAAFLWFASGGGTSDSESPPLEAADPADTARDSVADDGTHQAVDVAPTVERTEPVAIRDTAGRAKSDPFRYRWFRNALGKFRGRVVDTRGAPVAGLVARFFRRGREAALLRGATTEPLTFSESRTDASGEFELGRIWTFEEGFTAGELVLERPGGMAIAQDLRKLPKPGRTIDLGTIHWPDSTRIVGRVVAADGARTANVRIRAVRGGWVDDPSVRGMDSSITQSALRSVASQGRGPGFVRETRTGANGAFAIEDCAQGIWALSVHLDREFAVGQWHGDVSAPQTDVGTIAIGALTVRGVVVEADGTPVAGAELWAGTAELSLSAQYSGIAGRHAGSTDAAGRFEIQHVDKPKITIAVRRGVNRPWTVFADLDSGEEHKLELSRSFDLRFVIVDETGATLRSGYELVFGPRTPDSIRHLGQPMQSAPKDLELRLDDRLRQDANGVWTLPDGPLGALWVAAISSERAGFAVLSMDPKQTVPVPMVSHPIEVVVRAANGRPVRGARVTTAPIAQSKPGRHHCFGVTDDNGRIEVFAWTHESFRLSVRHPGLPTHESVHPIDTRRIEVSIHGYGSLTGVITMEGAPPPPLLRILRYQSITEPGHRSHVGIANPNAEGRFHAAWIPTGEYRLDVPTQLVKTRFDVVPPTVSIRPGKPELLRLQLVPAAGQALSERTAITGSVTINEKPADGFQVSVRDQFAKTYKAPVSGGRFRIDAVPEGKRTIKLLTADAIEIATREVELVAGREHDVEFALDMTSLRGAVHANGVDLSQCSVKVGDRRTTRCDASGAFSFDWLPTGKTTVQAFLPKSESTSDPVTVQLEKNRTGRVELFLDTRIRIRWQLPDALALRIDDPSRIRLDLVGPESGSYRFDSNGTFESSRKLKPGEYRVHVFDFGTASARARSWFTKAPIVIDELGTSELTLELVRLP